MKVVDSDGVESVHSASSVIRIRESSTKKVQDLTLLGDINEPCVLHALRFGYWKYIQFKIALDRGSRHRNITLGWDLCYCL
jgi:hypothetical protein